MKREGKRWQWGMGKRHGGKVGGNEVRGGGKEVGEEGKEGMRGDKNRKRKSKREE